jgi:hypothetical protein
VYICASSQNRQKETKVSKNDEGLIKLAILITNETMIKKTPSKVDELSKLTCQK